MSKKESLRFQESLSRAYAIRVLGKDFIKNILKGDASKVRIVEMSESDSATDGDVMRLDRGTILTTLEPESMKRDESSAGLIQRLNLVDVQRARRCDLGTIIERAITIPAGEGKPSQSEWAGAGIDLLDETQTRFRDERKSSEYKNLSGRCILFPGILVGTAPGPSLVLLDLKPEGPQVTSWQFSQNDYDMEPGEMLIARGQVAKKKSR